MIKALAIAVSLSVSAPAAGQDAPAADREQVTVLLECVGDAAIRGAAEDALRGQIAFLCALARAPVSVSCGRYEYMLETTRNLCARRDQRFWTAALIRAYERDERPDAARPRLAELSADCEGVPRGAADPVGCLTNAIWRDWAHVASNTFLDLLAARQDASQ